MRFKLLFCSLIVSVSLGNFIVCREVPQEKSSVAISEISIVLMCFIAIEFEVERQCVMHSH